MTLIIKQGKTEICQIVAHAENYLSTKEARPDFGSSPLQKKDCLTAVPTCLTIILYFYFLKKSGILIVCSFTLLEGVLGCNVGIVPP